MKALIAKKIGMTQVYMEDGKSYPATVLDVSGNVVSKVVKSNDQVTHIEIAKDKKKTYTKADEGNYKALGFVPMNKRMLKVSEGDSLKSLEVGTEVPLTIFAEGEKIDIAGVTKGKGFAGVVKRYKMKGGPRTHGQSDRERAIGSIGMRTIPGRVWKGKRMAGHMGVINKTVENIKVLSIDNNDKLIIVAGSIPGNNGAYVLLKGAK